MADLWVQLRQDRLLTTAEILYYFPDYPRLLQQYVWQDYDQVPHFPCLKKFIAYWRQNLEGRVHSVRVTHSGLIAVGEIRPIELEVSSILE